MTECLVSYYIDNFSSRSYYVIIYPQKCCIQQNLCINMYTQHHNQIGHFTILVVSDCLNFSSLLGVNIELADLDNAAEPLTPQDKSASHMSGSILPFIASLSPSTFTCNALVKYVIIDADYGLLSDKCQAKFSTNANLDLLEQISVKGKS